MYCWWGRGLWSPNRWSDFDLTLRLGMTAGDVLLLECGGVYCYGSAKNGGGSGRVSKSGMALAPNPALKMLKGLPGPMFFIGLDPALRVW